MKIPQLVIFYNVIPFLTTAEELTKWKNINKFFNQNIISHSPLPRICVNCQTTHFKVHFYQKRCKVLNCMVRELLHPGEDYRTPDNGLICNLGCLMNYANRQSRGKSKNK